MKKQVKKMKTIEKVSLLKITKDENIFPLNRDDNGSGQV